MKMASVIDNHLQQIYFQFLGRQREQLTSAESTKKPQNRTRY